MSQLQPRENPSGADNEQGSLTATDLAWLAGHFDGDGWIGLVRQKRKNSSHTRYSAAAMITTTSSRIVQNADRTLSRLGITHMITEYAPKDVIRADGTISPHRRKWNIVVRSNSAAREFLSIIRPYLIEKGHVADIALEYVYWRESQKRNPGGWDPELSAEIRRRAEDAMARMREDRQRDDPSTTTRLAPAEAG